MSEENSNRPGSDRKIDLTPLLEKSAEQEPSSAPRHRSLEKTETQLGSLTQEGEPQPDAQGTSEDPPTRPLPPPAADASDSELLRAELESKSRRCAGLEEEIDQLRRQLETTRSDYSGQSKDRLLEIRTLKDLLQRSQAEAMKLSREAGELGRVQKELKAQNLVLQYQLNSWGMPVIASEDGRSDDERRACKPAPFFPVLTPLPGGPDPAPVILRGDLSSFYFPNLLHFLANANLAGVVTVVTDGIVAKLFLEKAVLFLAGWNNRDLDLSLATLLVQSEIVPEETLNEFVGQDLYDLDLASILVSKKKVAVNLIQSGLKEHARVILSFLFRLKRGGFFFQAGQLPRRRDLQFKLAITDVLLKTAAEMDEKTRAKMGLVSS